MCCGFFFFFDASAPTELYTLSLHDALPILVSALCLCPQKGLQQPRRGGLDARFLRSTARATIYPPGARGREVPVEQDRKSTRLNSSHRCISYAVFCLKKKKVSDLRASMCIA